MKRNLILISILVLLQSCTGNRQVFDPYGRVNIVNKKPVIIKRIEKQEPKQEIKYVEIKEEYHPQIQIRKEINLTPEEKKLYDEIYNPSKKVIITEINTDPSKIVLTPDGQKVLRLMKKYYNLIESYEIMEIKTKEAIAKIRIQGNKNIDSLKIIKEIHEVIKETKTRSYVLATARALRNRGIK